MKLSLLRSLAPTLALVFAAAGVARAQVTPAPAIDAPPIPLAGPPSNQPPRQLAPESDAASDPAMAGTRPPPMTLGLDRGQKRCRREHRGYDTRTRSYPDAQGRQHPCG